MAAKWTADWVNRLFILKAGVTEIDVQVDLYSDWKEEVKLSDNMKHPVAMRAVGGDPISGTQNLGATYFLINGWRIRPDEVDHELTITGNLFSDPAGENIVVPTLGTYTVLVTNVVSNLVDSSVARLDLTQLLEGVHIDTTNGTAGTEEGKGTPTNPVNNVTDARIIANRDNLRAYVIVGSSITLNQDHIGWAFRGKGNAILNPGGYDLSGSEMQRCEVTGTMTTTFAEAVIDEGKVNGISGFRGSIGRSIFEGTNVLAGTTTINSSASNVSGPAAQPIIDMNTGTIGAIDLSIRQWSGGIRIEDCVTGSNVSVDMVSGHCYLHTDVSGGAIVIRGVGKCTDNSTGATVDTSGFVDGRHVNTFNANPVVYIDTNGATTGTDLDKGTATNPVNNLTDARTIADREGISTFKFRGTLTLDQNYSDWAFLGLGSETDNTVNFNSQTVNRTIVRNATVTGTMTGKIELQECSLVAVVGFEGVARWCGLQNTTQLANNAKVVFETCFSEVAGTNTPAFDIGTNCNLNVRHYSGGLKLENFTAGCTGTVDLDSGHLVLDGTDLGGTLVVRGVGHLTDQGSSGMTIVTDGLVQGTDTSLTRKILVNRLETDPVSGVLTIYDDDNTPLGTAQLFEDVSGSQTYRGSGAERRNKLS
jgi:hypothetical protein